MMHRATTTLGVIVGGAVLALALPGNLARAEEPAHPRLVGRWKLNKELSEDARAKLAEARQRGGRPGGPGGGGMGGPGGGGMGGPGGGWGGGRPGGMSGGRGGERGGMEGRQGPDGPGRARFQALLDPPEMLTITGNDAELTLDAGDEVLVRLHVDGRKYKQEGGRVETKTEWKGAELVVETKPLEGAGKVTTTYSLAPEAGRLQIVTRIESPRGGDPVSVKRLYDPAPLE